MSEKIQVLSEDQHRGVSLFIPKPLCGVFVTGSPWGQFSGAQVAEAVEKISRVQRSACQQVVKDNGLLNLIEGLLAAYKERMQAVLDPIAKEATP